MKSLRLSRSVTNAIVTALAVGTGAPALAASQTLKTESGKVSFLAVGKPSFLKIRGEGKAPTGTIVLDGGKASGELKFELATLDTGIEMRNEHMKTKYLEVEKHPTAVLKFKDAVVPDGGGTVTIPGELTLHGQTKPVSVEATIAGDAGKKNATATFKTKITDYGIDIPTYSGITVADEVTITAEVATAIAPTK